MQDPGELHSKRANSVYISDKETGVFICRIEKKFTRRIDIDIERDTRDDFTAALVTAVGDVYRATAIKKNDSQGQIQKFSRSIEKKQIEGKNRGEDRDEHLVTADRPEYAGG